MNVISTTMNDTGSWFKLHVCTQTHCCTSRKVSLLRNGVYKQVVVAGTSSDCKDVVLDPTRSEDVFVEVEHAGPDGVEAWEVDLRVLGPAVVSCNDPAGQPGDNIVLPGNEGRRISLACYTRIYL